MVTIRGIPVQSWSSYVPDSTSITYSTITESSVDLVVDQIKYNAFSIDDVDIHQTDFDVMASQAERVAIAGKELVDLFLLTEIAAAVPVYNTIGGTPKGMTIPINGDNIYDVLCDLYTTLGEAKVFGATNQRPWLIVPYRVEGEIKKSRNFTHATDMGDEIIRKGVIGEIAGFEIKVSTQLTLTPETDTYDSYYNVLAGVNLGYSFVQQINTSEDLRLETKFATGNRSLMVYGGKAVNDNALAKLVCKVSV
jgi:hypothetical protein